MTKVYSTGKFYRKCALLAFSTLVAITILSSPAIAADTNSQSSEPYPLGSTPTVSLQADFTEVPFGRWSGLKGIALPPGDQVILEAWNGSAWQEFKRVDPVQGNFNWFFPNDISPRDYRARYMDATSETVTIALSNRIEVWHGWTTNRFGQWNKDRGVGGGAAGGWKGKTLHLQRWNKDRWKWVASAKTNRNGSGYFEIWFPVFSGGTFRVATEGSAIVSNETPRFGSKIHAWQNSKVHGILLDGYRNRVSGVGVYLQRWEEGKNRWVWEASGMTSSEGYVNFTPKYKADYRLGTWGSRVTSNWVNQEETQVLSYLSRWPSDRTPPQYSDLEVYALAKDQNGEPIEGARAEFAWWYSTGIYRETSYTNSSGVATSTNNIGGAMSGREIYVAVWATYRGKTIKLNTTFTPE